MPCDLHNHRRRSIRLKRYDYSLPGAYFVTIVTQGRLSLFGEVVAAEMHLNDVGRMVETWWLRLPTKFDGILLDGYVIMPNHLHGIVTILEPDIYDRDVGADPRVGPKNADCTDKQGAHMGAPLHTVIQWLKTMTTNAYLRGVRQGSWRPLRGKLWQRTFFDHIIRNDDDLFNTRRYIAENPLRWALDEENPANAQLRARPRR